MIILTVSAIVAFVWLLFQAIKLFFKVAWGLAKVVGTVLCIVAFPLLVVFLLSAGGILIFLPVLLVAAACGVFSSELKPSDLRRRVSLRDTLLRFFYAIV